MKKDIINTLRSHRQSHSIFSGKKKGHKRNAPKIREKISPEEFETAPMKESMRKQLYKKGEKIGHYSNNINYSFHEKFLESRIGEKWDDIYSEIRAVLHGNTLHEMSLLDQILDSVDTKAYEQDGYIFLSGHYYNNSQDYYYLHSFYVCPITGCLEKTPVSSSRMAGKQHQKDIYDDIENNRIRSKNAISVLSGKIKGKKIKIQRRKKSEKKNAERLKLSIKVLKKDVNNMISIPFSTHIEDIIQLTDRFIERFKTLGRYSPRWIGYATSCFRFLLENYYNRLDVLGIMPIEEFETTCCILMFYCFKKKIYFHDRQEQILLMYIALHYRERYRDPDDWGGKKTSGIKRFVSLVHHLYSRFKIPRFFDSVWGEWIIQKNIFDAVKLQKWFLHVAGGKNIRTAPDLPIPFTRKMAGYFLKAPDSFNILSALRFGHVSALGGNERTVRGILGTNIGEIYINKDDIPEGLKQAYLPENIPFWDTVFRFFIENPMLDTAQYGPVIDCIIYFKFTPTIPNPAAHETGQPALIPAQPLLSMKGRTLNSVLNLVEQWHQALNREQLIKSKLYKLIWEPSGFSNYKNNIKDIEIIELLNQEDLKREGSVQRHCVASYNRSCAEGEASIWSMRKNLLNGRVKHLLTIEVRNKQALIVQARGFANRLPKPYEKNILKAWAKKAKLEISTWLNV